MDNGRSAKKRGKMSYEKKKALYGYGFISIWVIGFILFFARPMILVISYTFSRIEYPEIGYTLVFRGLTNYRRAFFEDPDIMRLLYTSLQDLVMSAPIIIVISIIIAVVLNKKFFGRTAVRAMFFIPVIVASGIVISILNGDIMANTMLAGQKTSSLIQMTGLRDILYEFNLPDSIINYVVNAAGSIFRLLWKSGIQILLFLASLQTIPSSLFEASSIEGATEWDNFWKIRIPMISPMILTAIIYTIVDSFTDFSNLYMRRITELATTYNVEYSATLSILYFIVIMALIGLVYLVVSRFIFYNTD